MAEFESEVNTAPESGGRMEESGKDLSTTVVGLLAAYLMPGAISLGFVSWRKPCLGSFLIKDGTHVTVAFIAAFGLSLLLNGLRIAFLSRLLFTEISENVRGYKGLDEEKLKVLQGSVDEVFRLHQFYAGVFFVFPAAFWYYLRDAYSHYPMWEYLLLILGGIVAWRVVAASVLDEYELYHQLARGALGIAGTKIKPGRFKSWMIATLFEWKVWEPYEHIFK